MEVTGTVGPCTTGSSTFTVTTPRTDLLTLQVFSVDHIRAMLVQMTGEIKTLVDAAVTDSRQNKALKDVMHEAIWRNYKLVVDYAGHKCNEIDGRQPVGEFWPFPFGSKSPTPPQG